MDDAIQTYCGVTIRKNEDGYYAEHGSESFGYHDNLSDIREEIDAWADGPDDARARQGIGWN